MTADDPRRVTLAAPRQVSAHSLLAAVLDDLGRSEDALARLRHAVAVEPHNPQLHCDLAAMLHQQGQADDAIRQYRQALALVPDHVAAHLGLGVALAAIGRRDEAASFLEKSIDLDRVNAHAYYYLGQVKRFAADNRHFIAMQELARNTTPLSLESQIYLQFALGRAYADVGDYDRSFRHLEQGNALRRQHVPYIAAKELGWLERIRSVFTAALMREKAGLGEHSSRPVFIIGMHRSGSTLVEQILASHPRCFAGGELGDIGVLARQLRGPNGAEFPECMRSLSAPQSRMYAKRYLDRLRRLSATAERVTDKMPLNFVYAGLIHVMFPNARIVHTRRDPHDTAISCYSNILSDAFGYANDLADLGRFYRQYRILMAHWRSVLPEGVMLEVDYEALVEDFGAQARRIVAHCGLDWDDACSAFYRNERSVRTASVGQVHEPIYRRSVGRWRHYQKFLGPFIEALESDESRSASSAK